MASAADHQAAAGNLVEGTGLDEAAPVTRFES
jgi:hypothetical protein